MCKEVYAKCGLKQLESDECVFLTCAQNIKGQPPLTAEAILESGAFHTMTMVPSDECVFLKCAQNIKGQPPLTAEAILESGAFHTLTIVPIDQRVYALCLPSSMSHYRNVR